MGVEGRWWWVRCKFQSVWFWHACGTCGTCGTCVAAPHRPAAAQRAEQRRRRIGGASVCVCACKSKAIAVGLGGVWWTKHLMPSPIRGGCRYGGGGDKRVWSSGIDKPHPCSSGRTRNRARQARRGLRNAAQNKAASSRTNGAGGARASGKARACMAYADMRATYNVGHDVSNEQTTIRCGCFCAGDGRRALLLLAKPNGPAWVVPERLMSERDE